MPLAFEAALLCVTAFRGGPSRQPDIFRFRFGPLLQAQPLNAKDAFHDDRDPG